MAETTGVETTVTETIGVERTVIESANSCSPLVSVIVPAYNAEAFIDATLDSIVAQTYTNIEILVVDDGSKDHTASIVASFAERDRRIKLLQQPNAGVAAARNLAIEHSTGEYIAPVDADDIWYPQKLEKQVQCMLQADPSVGLVYTWSAYINEDGVLTGGSHSSNAEGAVYVDLLFGNIVGNASNPLIRRVCFEQVGGYNCQLKAQNAQGYEDGDLYLRIAERYHFRVVPEFLIGYRQTLDSMSCNYAAMAKSYLLTMADVQQRHPEIPAMAYRWSCSRFYSYLAQRSYQGGNYGSTLIWFRKALSLDLVLLSRRQTYKLLIGSFFKLAAQPLTSLLWSNHRSWLQFKQRSKSKLVTSSAQAEQIRTQTNVPKKLASTPPSLQDRRRTRLSQSLKLPSVSSS